MFDLVCEMRNLNTTMMLIEKTLKLILKELAKNGSDDNKKEDVKK